MKLNTLNYYSLYFEVKETNEVNFENFKEFYFNKVKSREIDENTKA